MKRFAKLIISLGLIISCIFISCASTGKTEQTPKAVSVSGPETDEYKRSKGNVNVSLEVFNQDKKEILEIINKLDTIMKNKDYASWVKYVDKESIDYWSKTANLQKAAARLPKNSNSIKLNSLEDYFKYVFINARVGKRVDEIRYESSTYVKAVQVNGNKDTIYYYFNKIDGKWKLHLPAID